VEIPEQSGNASDPPTGPDPAQSGNGPDVLAGPDPAGDASDAAVGPEAMQAETESDVPPDGPEAAEAGDASDVPPDGPEAAEGGDASGVPPAGPEPIYVVDVVVGTTVLAAATARAVERRARRVVRPVARVVVRPVTRMVLRPPLVPSRFHAERLLSAVGRQGGGRRPELARQLSSLLDLIVPAIANALLARIDLTKIVAERVDLNQVVAAVDLDKAVEQLDLDAVVARLDLDALIARLDLAGLAEGVIAEVDLAEIIRQSSGSVASDTVQGVRLQGISGDEAVGRAVGRLRLRLTRHHEVAPGP